MIINSPQTRSRMTVIITSIVLVQAGIAGIALPQFISMAVALFAGWLMIITGGIAFYITWHGFRDRRVVRLKPFVLIVVGLLILLHPVAGKAAPGLMLAVYFLLDGFGGVGSARECCPGAAGACRHDKSGRELSIRAPGPQSARYHNATCRPSSRTRSSGRR